VQSFEIYFLIYLEFETCILEIARKRMINIGLTGWYWQWQNNGSQNF
jgi:hypothetical protein